MNILITGGAGFLGERLARSLLRDPQVRRLVLADRVAGADLGDPRVGHAVGDIADVGYVAGLVTPDIDTVFHLAAVVSGEAEADFDLGLRVNIDASRMLLDACRRAERPRRVIFTSSVAVFGPTAPGETVDDDTSVDPRSSYGMEKAVAELLLKDYSRRGLVDGLILRLPTISVRPGQPNRAASSFASGIIREPLAGLRSVCPAPLTTRLWLLSPDRAVEAMIHAAMLDTRPLGQQRVINLPGVSVTVSEMLDTLLQAAGPAVRALVEVEADPVVARIVSSWPAAWDDSRARALGFRGDADFRAIVDAYIAQAPTKAIV